ncbi:MAG: hypothetical protein AB8C84_04155 [Oligoflexales bacterium]
MKFFLLCVIFIQGALAFASSLPPAELESVGGFGLGYGNAGAAVHPGGSSVVRSNPALMTLMRRYDVSASYHWPTEEREFYQVGIVDSVSSQIAAGVQMTGFLDDLPQGGLSRNPITKRVHGAMSVPLGRMALGANVQNISWQEGYRKRHAQTYGIGFAGTDGAWIWGVSGENIRNADAAVFAPKVIRAGVTWNQAGVLLGAEISQRDRVPQERSSRVVDLRTPGGQGESEKMATFYGAYQMMSALSMTCAYKRSSDHIRQAGSLGFIYDHQPVQMSWQVSAPSFGVALHHALSLNLHVKV